MNGVYELVTVIVSPEAFAAALRIATPLVLAALGGLFAETGGVPDIALEGKLLAGALGAVVGGYFAERAGFGAGAAFGVALARAAACGVALSMVLAALAVGLRADAILAGLAATMLAQGATRLACSCLFESESNTPTIASLAVSTPASWAWVKDQGLPRWVEVALLSHGPLTYLALALVPACHVVLRHTPFGLALVATGGNEKAARAAGISLAWTRTSGLVFAGALAGLGGAALAVSVQQFATDMSAGRGYIALAALVLARGRSWGVLAATLAFALPEALAGDAKRIFAFPEELALALPYLVTLALLAVAGARWRS